MVSFLRSHIGIGVWRVVFLGCWMWLRSQLKWRLWWMGVRSGRVEAFQTCGVVQTLLQLT